MAKSKVWKSDTTGGLYHDDCFEENEPRDGYTIIPLDSLEDDDECESCEGVFLSGLTPDVDNDDEDDE